MLNVIEEIDQMMRRTSLCLALALGFSACSPNETPDEAGPHSLEMLEDGKFDNYISTNAREFELHGHAHVTLPADFDSLDDEAKAERLDRLVQQRLTTVSRSVQRHVEDVVREYNRDLKSHQKQFFTYFRPNNTQRHEAEIVDGNRARFAFEMELVGSPLLMSRVAPDSTTRRTFDVEVKEWNDPSGEIVTVEIKGSPSRDSFPQYHKMFEDGVLDIGMHFGGDYNAGRYDIETAKWTVEYLLEKGWKNTAVTSFDDLTLDSPPFTQTIYVEGRNIEVQVYISHSEMDGPGEQPRLAEAMKKSFAERDIVLYSGHAGSGAGFILDYHPRYEIPARDFATMEMADKYQIYVLDGCNTYRTYVDDLLKNPAKDFSNVDIVTTVNTTPFGRGYMVIHQLLYWLTITDEAGNHYPLSWQTILRGLNTKDYDNIYYGVHGVDDNPQINPHASEGVACTPCASDSDCGAGGNLCLNYRTGSACGVACTTDEACGPGYRCARLFEAEDYWYIPKQCVRRDLTCG
jgi:hypothetical protein